MSARWTFWAALMVLTGVALFLRLYRLDNRPMHADESVHAFKLWDLYSRGRYVYNPDEYHGPTHYYLTLPVVAARRPSSMGDLDERDCRLGVAILAALTIPAVALLRRTVGHAAVLLAACLLALSPAHVFYSRYFIQESLLVLFMLLMLAAWAGYVHAPSRWMAAAVGLTIGLMLATKETALPTLAVWLLTCAAVRMPRELSPQAGRLWRDAAMGMVTAVAVGGAILSNGFRNAGALPRYLYAFAPWLERAHGTDLHSHPWDYYLRMLVWHRAGPGPVWTEPLLIGLALIGAWAACRKTSPTGLWERRLVVVAALLFAFYSAVPYKTPWCILTPLMGITISAGIGGAWLLDWARPAWVRRASGLAIALGLVHCARLAWQTSFVHQTNPANPYAYAQTVPDALDIQHRAEALARVHPSGDRMVVKVIWSDPYYWPIPWYLRRFPNVGYYQGMPKDASAPLILAAPEYDEELSRRLDATHLMNGYIGLRPHVVAQVWVDFELWKRYIESKQRLDPKDGTP